MKVYRKEFFGLLLLVSLISTAMFTGFVWAPAGPAISVYPSTGVTLSSDTFVCVTGTGWTSGTPVTVFWDMQTANHTVAIVTPSYGSFRVDRLEIEGMSVGTHTVIAVQGANKATAQFTVSSTTPPDDRLLGAVQELENKLDNATSGLPGIQSNFTTVLNDITAIENKLDNTTWGLPGIQSNFTTVLNDITAIESKLDNKTSGLPGILSSLNRTDSDVKTVESKLDPGGRLDNVTLIETRGGFNWTEYVGDNWVENCTCSETAEFTATVYAHIETGADGQDGFYIWATFDGTNWDELFYVPSSTIHCDYRTITIAARGVAIDNWCGVIAHNYGIDWGISVQHRPSTTLTWSP